MTEKIVSKNTLMKLLESDNTPLAIADKNQKIVWTNKSFKDILKLPRLKGKDIADIFDIPPDADISKLKNKGVEFETGSNEFVSIKKIINDKKWEGFSIKISESKPGGYDFSPGNEQFIKDFKNILTLLVKDTSLTDLAKEILNKCISLSKSSFGIIVYNIKNGKKKYDYTLVDNNYNLKNFDEIKSDIETNLNFLNKWLNANKRSLTGQVSQDNLASNLTGLLRSESIILSPGIFENDHIATIIVAKTKGKYSDFEINVIEQFAALLSFAITSTQARELNTALENKLLQAQKLETIGKLSSGMAHDFSNLLSSIFGSVNLLRKRVEESENVTRLIDNIETCSIRARDLTKGLLSFGKPTPKRKELIKPNLLLTEILKVVTHTFPGQISFDHKIEENLYDILGNGTEIYQVLLNLCVNAKEAMDKKGNIALTGKNIVIDKKNNHMHPLLKNGKYVWFSVSDTGSGINEENLLRIFDPYFSTKEKETGSGLGLYVTYGIIKAHNGEIEVSSKVDQGTTFDVFIPAYEPQKITTDEEDKIILLAEDEVMLSELLSELLESTGYNVIRVYNGREVIKVLTEEIKVDMVILDYNMPGLNGLECAAKIRELKLEMPIILSTGSMSQAEKPDLAETGITSTLTKPYEFDTLLSTIHKLI